LINRNDQTKMESGNITMVKKITWPSIAILLVGISCSNTSQKAAPESFIHAHAHNDYDHARPLNDALDHGFTSVEADVILKHDSLYVAHDPEDIVIGQTLQSLYLDPLYKLYKENGGKIYPDWPTVNLMIDFKTDADSTYDVLRPLLDEYADMLTRWIDGEKKTKALTIIVSGNRPIETAKNETSRMIGIDGRPDDLNNNISSSLYPWISDNWTNHFEWRGHGELPAEEQAKLDSMVKIAHANGHLVRFWATDSHYVPARQNMWATLLDAGVDIINTDDLAGLADFLRNRAN
jgi:hypothetical protein